MVAPTMPATLDTRKAHLVRQHGDIVAIFTWINDERALVLVPANRPGAPWYVVMESAAYTWDDNLPANRPGIVRKASKACEVLGFEPTARNVVRIGTLICDALPELTRMPSAPVPDYLKGSFGQMILKEAGQVVAAEDIRLEKEGVTYG